MTVFRYFLSFYLVAGLTACVTLPANQEQDSAKRVGAQREKLVPGWIADEKGCRVWNSNPQYDESITWSGPCENTLANGNGTLQWFTAGKPGQTMIGDYKNGRPSGKIVEIQTNGDRYEGEVLDGLRNGKGVMTWMSGVRYEGEFANGGRSGFGKMVVPRPAYVAKDRSDKGMWVGDDFVEQGLFEKNRFVYACKGKLATNRAACEKQKTADEEKLARAEKAKLAKEKQEIYRSAFRKASTSSDYRAFISQYANDDPEKLVPQARQKLAAVEKRERAAGELQAKNEQAAQQRVESQPKKTIAFKRLACVTWNNSYSRNPFFKNADIVEHKISANMLEKSGDQCEVKIRSQKHVSLVSGPPPYNDNESVVVECALLSPC